MGATARLRVLVLACVCPTPAGCEPTVSFPPTEQPVVGVVLREREVIATGDALTVRLIDYDPYYGSVGLEVPARAVAPGTRLLVRVLRGIQKALPDGPPFDVWGVTLGSGEPLAVQILPATVTFAAAPTLTVETYRFGDEQFDLLAAEEPAAAWQRRSGATTVGSEGDVTVTIKAMVDGPHLWSFASRPIRGSFVQGMLSCGGQLVSAPRDTLVLGAADYTWTRTPFRTTGCATVETGRFYVTSKVEVEFQPVGAAVRRYSMSQRIDGLDLDRYGFGDVVECPAQQGAQQSFSRIADGADAGTTGPAPADGACSSGPREGGDAGVD